MLSADLMDELTHLVGPFETETVDPTEVRIAQAELVGWLEGVFSGLITVAISDTVTADTDASPWPDDRYPGNYL